jgi:hypothetical protein
VAASPESDAARYDASSCGGSWHGGWAPKDNLPDATDVSTLRFVSFIFLSLLLFFLFYVSFSFTFLSLSLCFYFTFLSILLFFLFYFFVYFTLVIPSSCIKQKQILTL